MEYQKVTNLLDLLLKNGLKFMISLEKHAILTSK